MAGDINKHLDRAKRFLEKNRVEDAIAAYLSVLDEAPQHQEATQALGDLYSRTEQPDLAAVHYGLLFDMLIDPRDENKALAIYNRFLRSGTVQQPPERIARYAFLQQKQNHGDEAIEQYSKAAELFTSESRAEDALFCLERIAQLDPENPVRQLRLAEAAESISRNALAARAYLRAGQLATARGEHADGLKLLHRAYVLGSSGAQRGAVVCRSQTAGRKSRGGGSDSRTVFHYGNRCGVCGYVRGRADRGGEAGPGAGSARAIAAGEK